MTTKSPYILGVDIGTGSAKTIAVTTAGQIPASRRQTYPTLEPVPGYSEQDPEQVLAAIIKTIRETVAEMGYAPAAISLSSAMHSLLAVDADGEPLTPVMTWADNRAEDYAAALRNTPEGKDIHRATGTPIHPMSPLCKIQWIREQQPEIFDQAACFVGIKDLFLFRCFHEFITDYSLASCSGLFDIRALDWYAPALKLAGITDDRLPIPVETTRLLIGMDPAMAQAMGVPDGTLIMAGSSDGCLAQLGSGAVEPGHAALTIGTSGAIRVMSPKPADDPAGRIFSYVLTPEHYVCGGAMNNGGVALQWFSKAFLPWSDYNDFLKTAFTAPAGSDGLLCLPYMLGERAPVWDSRASGAFVGMRQHHGSPHFQRALVEGICFNLLNIGEALESVTGDIREVTVSGGFTASPLWIQLLADIFRKPMLLHQDEDASALGAAMLAWHALEQVDAWQFNSAAAARVFEPAAEHAPVYERNYRAYSMLYERLKDVTDILREK
ncbi:gluconokinase [Chitinophaga caseinilytica]|uniref:Gluconokinase n=1 Tax=Chitinophaga caseinilytica TaxID=2267521 RepID=A0ABZ2Z568_9BACT